MLIQNRQGMRNYISFFLIIFAAANGFAVVGGDMAQIFGADDLRLSAAEVSSYQAAAGENILSFDNNFELVIGDNHFKSSQAIVWIKSNVTQYRGITTIEHNVTVYLQGKVSIDRGRGSATSGLEVDGEKVAGVESMVTKFTVNGEVFITAEKRIEEDTRTSQLYRNALAAVGQIKLVPSVPIGPADSSGQSPNAAAAQETQGSQRPRQPGFLERMFGGVSVPPPPPAPAPKFQYPINFSSLSTEPVKFTNEVIADGTNIATIMNRFYLWQKQDEQGGLLELQADAAVIFYSRGNDPNRAASDANGFGNTVKAIYLFGDCIMTEGLRTIRADEFYYDFQKKQALAVNAIMRNYDTDRGIPIYVKAAKLRQLSEHKFRAENVVLTSSEFYVPRVVMTASEIVITDTTSVDAQTGQLGRHSYDVMMKNAKLKVDKMPVFYLPKFHANLERPDIPLRKATIGKNSDFGFVTETEWYLTRVLGLREPRGVDSSLMLDYYSKRGIGVGARIIYQRDNYFGNIDGYIISDRGKDDLSRNRENIVPPQKLRGKFKFQHRQFMPYNWQLTLETTYLSDQNYMESFNRRDFLSGKEEETVVHLKRLEDNWAFAIMGKWRINDFDNTLQELPSAQYHLKAKSLFNDKVTMYHDSSLGRYMQKIGKTRMINITQQTFTFGSSRTELDMPMKFGTTKVVPFIAGTFGYDDRSGFARGPVTETGGGFGSKEVFIGQIGARASRQYWKVYKNVRSEFWDLEGIRHIIKPYANISMFAESDNAVKQKDIINIGLLQRLQTKRGRGEKQRIVEWMRLNMDFTWVSDEGSSIRRPDRLLWNETFVPLAVFSAPDILNGDMASAYRMYETYGPQRDSFNADYIWRVSDTLAILSDMNYDLQSRKVEQFNIGFSRLCLPNLSYYIGARYLRSTNVDGEQGTNAVTLAVTYKLSPRYTITFLQQHDFDYGRRILSQVSLIRRYHRLFYALTASRDESLDSSAVVLSIWPEGVSELSVGSMISAGTKSSDNLND
jgi:hypothetical protein